jgi:hypothetical protein
VDETVEELEERITALRAGVRRAVLDGDGPLAGALRRDLRHAERAWDAALDSASTDSASTDSASTAWPGTDAGDAAAPVRPGVMHVPSARDPAGPGAEPGLGDGRGRGALLPLREQVHEALSLLQVPAAPRLIATVHEAFFALAFPTARLTSLRRDEERSFRSAPFARPYYICAALSADYLAPSRGLLAISTWPAERRIIGSLSPRVDFLVSAINVARAIEQVPEPVPAARALLSRFAANVRGSSGAGGRSFGPAGRIDPQVVIRAAQAELEVHAEEDQRTRAGAARRARDQLDDAQQLFGAGIRRPRSGEDDEDEDEDGRPGRKAAGGR